MKKFYFCAEIVVLMEFYSISLKIFISIIANNKQRLKPPRIQSTAEAETSGRLAGE